MTSLPYFQQRDYGGMGIGNESTEDQYLDNLLKIFFESVRVVKDTGTIVYNLGDKYKNGGLSLIPYKFAIRAVESEKIFLVNNLQWIKLNPTPRQDKRKLIQTTEPFFIFAKSKNYYFNSDNFLAHLDHANKLKKNRPSEKLGKTYFDLIEKSELTQEQKKKAEQELDKTIRLVHEGKIESFRMKIRGLHSEPYNGQKGGRKIQIENNGFTIIKIYGKRVKKDIIESPVETIRHNKHPAVYPLYVIQELIKLLTEPDAIVLDPFCGSGTSCLAAANIGRDYIGIEINKDYVDFAKERIKLEGNKQQELFL
ncbi:DNA methyltransferase [Desulfobacterales bacterium HSG2]|nr:DNA methyltransferase [Desulfobacterales bacterium HSG2]